MDMNEFQHKPSVEIVGRTSADVDQGLRNYMIKVFNYMGLGLLLTTAVAWFVANNDGLLDMLYDFNMQEQTITLSGLGWIVALAPLAMIFAFNYVLHRLPIFSFYTPKGA